MYKIQQYIYENHFKEILEGIKEKNSISSVQGLLQWLLEENRKKRSSAETRLTIKVLKYIEDNYTKDISSGTIAENFGVSEGSLRALFKKDTGITVKDYILKQRIGLAKELLKEGKKKIYEVAHLSLPKNSFNVLRRESTSLLL